MAKISSSSIVLAAIHLKKVGKEATKGWKSNSYNLCSTNLFNSQQVSSMTEQLRLAKVLRSKLQIAVAV